jgi:hypothetical protein
VLVFEERSGGTHTACLRKGPGIYTNCQKGDCKKYEWEFHIAFDSSAGQGIASGG